MNYQLHNYVKFKMAKKNIETKVGKDKQFRNLINPSGDVLRYFCIENSNTIVACDWYNTKYCLKTCKFYNKMENAKNSTKAK